MKKFFIATFACAALASCYNNDTTIATNLEPINFGDNFVENSVRADDPTYGAGKLISEFYVYGTVNGVNIFNADRVYSLNTDGSVDAYNAAWNCDKTQYWIDGAAYDFAAVVDANTVNVDNSTKMPVSLEYTAAGQKDLLYAEFQTTGKPAANNGLVGFTFKHLLSKVNVTFQNTTTGEDAGYKIKVRDIKFDNSYATGTYAMTTDDKGVWTGNGTWTGETATDAYTDFGSIEGVANGGSATIATERLVIPTTEPLKLSFIVDIVYVSVDNGITTETTITTTEYTGDKAKTIATNLVAGYAYNITISQSLGSKIEFTVSQNPAWVNGSNPGKIEL